MEYTLVGIRFTEKESYTLTEEEIITKSSDKSVIEKEYEDHKADFEIQYVLNDNLSHVAFSNIGDIKLTWKQV